MPFQKTIKAGPGNLIVAVSGQQASVEYDIAAQLGGGQAAGVAGFQSSNKVFLSDAQLEELAFDYLKAKYPSASVEIAAVEAVVVSATSAL